MSKIDELRIQARNEYAEFIKEIASLPLQEIPDRAREIGSKTDILETISTLAITNEECEIMAKWPHILNRLYSTWDSRTLYDVVYYTVRRWFGNLVRKARR